MTITAEEVTAQWAVLQEKIDEGESVTITRQGVPFAQLAPAPTPAPMTSAEAIEKLKELRKGVRLDGLSMREMINEGRR